jgi:hypothetical protein
MWTRNLSAITGPVRNADARSMASTALYQDAPITPEIVEEFLPNLLVA